MNYDLLYDADCSRCTTLAEAIKTTSAGRLGIRNMRDTDMTALLDRHAPKGKWEPMVLETDGDHVRVYRGLLMRVKLVQVLGISKAWQVAQLVIKADGPLLGFEPTWFRPLITTLGLGAIFSFFGFGSGNSNFIECIGRVCSQNCTTWTYLTCQNLCYYPDGSEACMGGWHCTSCA